MSNPEHYLATLDSLLNTWQLPPLGSVAEARLAQRKASRARRELWALKKEIVSAMHAAQAAAPHAQRGARPDDYAALIRRVNLALIDRWLTAQL
jgi:hypothetical protein